MAKKSEPKSQLDRIREVSPRYADLLVKHAELITRADEIKREVGGNVTKIHITLKGHNVVSQRYEESLGAEAVRHRSFVDETPRHLQPKPRPVERHAGGVSLVGDLLSPQPEYEVNPPPLPQRWPGEQRVRELGAESEAISEAIKLLAPEIVGARREYSKAVAAQRMAEYSEIVERVVEAARVLGNAAMAAHEFIDNARQDGVERGHFRPLLLTELGDIGEPHSPLQSIIARAIELKHVGAGKLPDWRLPASLDLIYSGV